MKIKKSLLVLFITIITCTGIQSFNHKTPPPPKFKVHILTLNLMGTSPVMSISDRLEGLSDFIRAYYLNKEPIDIILLQEGIGGLVVQIKNSINTLAQRLANSGIDYNVCTSSMSSSLVRPFIDYKLGILSLHTASPCASSNLGVRNIDAGFIENQVYNSGTRIMGRNMFLDGFGSINAYSLHLSGVGGPAGFELQARELLGFIHKCELENPTEVSIIAGDFNIDLDKDQKNPIMRTLTGLGFRQIEGSGPTFGIPGNPHSSNGNPRRIDGFFIKGNATYTSKVVLNTSGLFLSDHSGVLLTLFK